MKLLSAVVMVLVTAGCATTEFTAYQDRDGASYEGKGGAATMVDGVEVWRYGEPPKRFTVIGVIDDERPRGAVHMARLQGDIAKKAKAVGADAVIQLSSDSRITGVYNTAGATATAYGNSTTAYGSGVSVPIGRNVARFLVIKYAAQGQP